MTDKKSEAGLIGYASKIAVELGKFGVSIAQYPKRDNRDPSYGSAFMWATIEKHAKNKKEAAWRLLEAQELVDTKLYENVGDHELGSSKSFIATVKVSEKVRRFDPETLAQALNKKYKVPVPIALQMIEQAKVPSNSTVTKRIIERG